MRIVSWLLCFIGLHDWIVVRRSPDVLAVEIYERCQACSRGRIRRVRWTSRHYRREGGRELDG